MAKVAIITYSTYGHITILAREICKGLESNGVQATIFRVPETLCDTTLREMQAVDKPADVPIITAEELLDYDGYFFGVSTRFGNISAQMSRFFETCGDYFKTGELYHKLGAGFSATGTGAGKETAIRSLISFFTHQGIMYVPLGYTPAFDQLCNSSEEKGCSVWGSGSTAGADNSLIPSEIESEVAFIQGAEFAKVVIRSVIPKNINKVENTNKNGNPITRAPSTKNITKERLDSNIKSNTTQINKSEKSKRSKQSMKPSTLKHIESEISLCCAIS